MNCADAEARAKRPRFQPQPKPPKPKKLHILTEWSEDEYNLLKRKAAEANISLKSYVKQAVLFAVFDA